jgi:hypothetical protein
VQPSKELVLRYTFTLLDNTRRMMSIQMAEMVPIDNARLEIPLSYIEYPRIIGIMLKLKTI